MARLAAEWTSFDRAKCKERSKRYKNNTNTAVIMADNERDGKRQRETQPDVKEIMIIARRLWRRNPFAQYSAQQEDRDFRESFGCTPMVVLAAWNLLAADDLIPENGSLEHLLWTLAFMKSYNTRRNLSMLCGGADPGTIQKYAFAFIERLADLEPLLVRVTLIQPELSVLFFVVCNVEQCK